MTARLKVMRKIDTLGYYQMFGTNSESVRRLDEIMNEYAYALGQIAIYANQAQQTPLKDYALADITMHKTHAEEMSQEFSDILDSLQCVLEKNCGLIKK